MAFAPLTRKPAQTTRPSSKRTKVASPSAPEKNELREIGHSLGQELPPALQTRAATTFGPGLGPVRVHTDSFAARAAEKLSANAFTTGNDIYFGQGTFQPEQPRGLRLLGHELTHVAQQRAGLRNGEPTGTGDRYEREADSSGASFLEGRPATFPRTGMGYHGNSALSSFQTSTIQREEKTQKKEDRPFPTITAAVGKRCPNKPEDVAIVRGLLGLPLNDEDKGNKKLIKAIKKFQRETFGNGYDDGRIEPPGGEGRNAGMTWNALVERATGMKTSPPTSPAATGARVRQKFASELSIMLGPADLGGDEIVSDGDNDGMDDAGMYNRLAADEVGLTRHEVADAADATHVLEDYYHRRVSIDMLLISSHGYYKRNCFYLGKTQINAGNVDEKLKDWQPLLTTDTEVVIKSCHTGGGKNPKKGIAFTKQLADLLQATVYTSRGKAEASRYKFNDGIGSSIKGPSTWDKDEVKEQPNAYKHMGEWLEAVPRDVLVQRLEDLGIPKAEIEKFIAAGLDPVTVNAPIFHADGTFSISNTRFPGMSYSEITLFYKFLATGELPESASE